VRGRGFGAARPAQREGIRRGGCAFCTEAEGKRGRGSGASTREEREGERGSVRLNAAWREGGVGEGAWWPVRRAASGGGRLSVTCEQGRGRMVRVGRARGCGPTGERRELGRAQGKQCDFFI
jgi:hypothetical protein